MAPKRHSPQGLALYAELWCQLPAPCFFTLLFYLRQEKCVALQQLTGELSTLAAPPSLAQLTSSRQEYLYNAFVKKVDFIIGFERKRLNLIKILNAAL